MTVHTLQAAKTICDFSNWTISNLTLQKLLYLSHMIHLGKYGEPLINGSNPIVDIFPCDTIDINANEFECIKLVSMTHSNNVAWAKNYRPSIRGLVISNEDILNEYRNKTSIN